MKLYLVSEFEKLTSVYQWVSIAVKTSHGGFGTSCREERRKQGGTGRSVNKANASRGWHDGVRGRGVVPVAHARLEPRPVASDHGLSCRGLLGEVVEQSRFNPRSARRTALGQERAGARTREVEEEVEAPRTSVLVPRSVAPSSRHGSPPEIAESTRSP